MFTPESNPKPKADIVARIVDDEAVLVLPQQGKVKVLNEVGARIWELLDGQQTVKDIARTIHREYEVPQATAEADTLEFLGDLVEKDMVDVS
ncbi:MAG: Coenzyme PQQ synthesis protein D [Chloroflexi bacterium]|nr:Coenzyme PQQ synthesis protein D [Chloroflexota bacterium]